MGRNSVVGKPNIYGMDCPQGWGLRDFRRPSIASLQAYKPPVNCYGVFPGGKEAGIRVHHSPLSGAEVKENVGQYFYFS